MKLREFLHKALGKKPSMAAYQSLPLPMWTPRTYAHLSREGYEKNIIVFRCVTMIARGVGSVPLTLKKGEEIYTRAYEHPLLELLAQPNTQHSRQLFLETLVSHLLLSGNAYLNIVRDDQGQPCELYLLRPDRVQITTRHGMISMFIKSMGVAI